MSGHTPGPWVLDFSTQTGWAIWADPRLHGDMRRGAVVIAADLRGGKQDEANARLMAAAPDLLAAAQLLVDAYRKGEENGSSMDWSDVDQAWEAAKAAIAKATGT